MDCEDGAPGTGSVPTSKGGRTVFCVKFQKEMPGLDEVPFDNHPLGQRIYENVSKEAWKMWLEQMKMIMNEYRLNLGTQEAQEFLLKQMEDYFFGEGAALPPGYVPQRAKGKVFRGRQTPIVRATVTSAVYTRCSRSRPASLACETSLPR